MLACLALKNLLRTLLCAWQSDGLDISGSGAHDFKHYRTGKDVVTRLEYISSTQTKASNNAWLAQNSRAHSRVHIVEGPCLLVVACEP